MDTSEPLISFDERGICTYCRQYEAKHEMLKLKGALDEAEMAKRMDAIIEKIKADGKGKPYDCIIGLSGGVDSSFVARLVKKLGLRPLGVHFDNGWNSELATGNIENLCKKLGIELYTYVVNWNEFRDLQKSFLKAGVANAEIPTDHGIFATLYQLADKFKVNYIIDGVNDATEFVRKNFSASGWVYADLKHLKAIHKLFGTVPLKTFPTMSLLKKAWYQKVKKITQVSILNLINYHKEDAIKILERELEWRKYGGKHHESIFTKWHQLVYLPKRFGFDKRRVHLSDLILCGQITRQQAIDELSTKPISDTELQELEKYVQKKLGFSEKEYNKLLNSAPLSYKDYPNDEKLINLYQKFKK